MLAYATDTRVYGTQLRLLDLDVSKGLRTLEGRAVPYNAWTNVNGQFLESIAPGCFDRSCAQAARGLPLMVIHDGEKWPVGMSREWRSKRGGLYGVWDLDDSPEAQGAAHTYVLNCWSCGRSPRSCTPISTRSTPPSSSVTIPGCAGGR